MLKHPDKLIAALVIVIMGLLTALLPSPDLSRIYVMATLFSAAFITELLL